MNHNGSDSTLGLKVIKSDGTVVPVNADGTVTLPNAAATYYMPIGQQNAETPSICALLGIHLKWVAAFAAVITVEVCNFPANVSGQGVAGDSDVTDISANVGDWIQLNDAADGRAQTVGAGNTVAVLTITAGGTNQGGCFITLADLGGRRVRLKIAMTVSAGAKDLRGLARGKVGC